MAQNDDLSRREVFKLAGVAGIAAAGVTTAAKAGAPAIITAHAQNNQIKYGVIGTGSRGTYLLGTSRRWITAIALRFAIWIRTRSIRPRPLSGPTQRNIGIIASCLQTRMSMR